MLRLRNQYSLPETWNAGFLLTIFLSLSLCSLWAQSPRWPRTHTSPEGTLVLYQPQVDEWKHFQVVDALMAFSITPTGGKEHPGVATVRLQTSVDMDTHTVTLSNPQITSLYFPSLDSAATAQMGQLVRSFLRPSATMTISLDQLAASVQKKKPASVVAVNNDPPAIFISLRPAILLMVNGPPVMVPISQTSIKAIVNANWPLFFDQSTSTYYLFDGKGWMQGSSLESWTATGTLPAQMPNGNFML